MTPSHVPYGHLAIHYVYIIVCWWLQKGPRACNPVPLRVGLHTGSNDFVFVRLLAILSGKDQWPEFSTTWECSRRLGLFLRWLHDWSYDTPGDWVELKKVSVARPVVDNLMTRRCDLRLMLRLVMETYDWSHDHCVYLAELTVIYRGERLATRSHTMQLIPSHTGLATMLRPIYDSKIRQIADKSLTNRAIDLGSRGGWSYEQI